MAQVKHGDTVRLHYTCKLDDGKVFDTSSKCAPLQFTIGEDQVTADLELAVVGMNPGESKNIKIPADRAYGPYCNEMVLVVARSEFPEDLKPEVGQKLQIRQEDDEEIAVLVTHVSELSVTLDANHPLATKDLTIDISLIEII
jgi:FKBP-type peptidyl-prolyl cis-trans isomerase 2